MDDNGRKIIVCTDLHKAIEVQEYHCAGASEVQVEDFWGCWNDIKNGQHLPLGCNVPEALGDYFAAPTTLPNCAARPFSSLLGGRLW